MSVMVRLLRVCSHVMEAREEEEEELEEQEEEEKTWGKK